MTPGEAIALQRQAREAVRIRPLERAPRLVAGCDVSMNRFSDRLFGAFVVMTWPDLRVVEESWARGTATMPYVPGLLSFREMPVLLRAWEGLAHRPDLVFVDGVGIAHPRRLGIAAHLGITLDVPSIGCAKSVLTGTYDEPGLEQGDRTYLRDAKDPEERIGVALRTKRKVRPMFVSPGHLVDVDGAADLVMASVRRYRMPEPTRLAHEAANRARRASGGES